MTPWKDLYARYRAISANKDDLGVIIKPLPGAVRRMGLVRTIEGLGLGKHSDAGKAVFKQVAKLLDLPDDLTKAVVLLETCEREALFARHRRAIAVFDALVLIHRSESA